MSTFQVATYILAMIRLVLVIFLHALIAVRDPKTVLGWRTMKKPMNVFWSARWRPTP
jgi:hypothetical protein